MRQRDRPRGRRWDREIDWEGETGYGEIEEREREIRKYDRERERARIKTGEVRDIIK